MQIIFKALDTIDFFTALFDQISAFVELVRDMFGSFSNLSKPDDSSN